MDSKQIRESFVQYYQEMGHHILPRASMLDPSIPMSFVMSAGLVQVETSLSRSNQRDGNRFVLVQECFRHFDIDRVGTDDIHLSLFEMPGAFVFGPNEKVETIQKMWTLATSVLGLDKNNIWVSYFNGGTVLGNDLPADSVTCQAWRNKGIPENHIVGLGVDNNYWVQGKGIKDIENSRKCGPNTELFFDRGKEKACGQECKPGCKCGRFIEFSNSLFICSEIDEKTNKIRTLGNPFTETVIGTERVAMILQNVDSVFGIDKIGDVIQCIKRFTRNSDLLGEERIASERVIADHIRALYMLVADNAPPPGGNGRKRIIKVLIRGILTRMMLLDINSNSFISDALTCVALTMPIDGRPQLTIGKVQEYFSMELNRYSSSMDIAKKQLLKFLDENNGGTLSGYQIVYLEKKKGLPHLLAKKILNDHKLGFASDEYQNAVFEYNLSNGRLS